MITVEINIKEVKVLKTRVENNEYYVQYNRIDENVDTVVYEELIFDPEEEEVIVSGYVTEEELIDIVNSYQKESKESDFGEKMIITINEHNFRIV